METVLSGVIIVLQAVILYSLRKRNVRLDADIRTLYASIARDLNAVVSTIALYADPGATPRPVLNTEGGGEISPEQQAIESARRKAEIWRAARAQGGRK